MLSPVTTELHVTGMTCNNCARKVTEAAQKISGVHSVTVTVATARASVRWHSAEVKNIPEILAAISRAGFEAKEITAESNATGKPHRQNRWQWNLILGLAVTAALMLGEWGFHLMMTGWFRWLSFALATGVQIFCGAQFYRGAWRQIKVGQSNMDALVALGSTTAFSYSAWALLSGTGGHLYFMEAAAIISIISAGHWLEARVSDQASGALKSLMQLAPQTARKISNSELQISNLASQPHNLKTLSFFQSAIGNRQSAIETEVPVGDLKIGDRIALRPGDRVPVDGIVHRARPHHRRRAARANQPRRHPASWRPHQQCFCAGHCGYRARGRCFLVRPFRRGKSFRHRRRRFDCRVPVRDGSGDARRHHGQRQRRRAARNFNPRRRGAGKSGENYGSDF